MVIIKENNGKVLNFFTASILSYDIMYWVIFITGIVGLIYAFWQLFRKQDAEWIFLMRKKTDNHILNGFFGLMVIATISVFIPLLIQFIIVNLEIAVYNALLYFIALIASYGAAIILFLWFGIRTRYETSTNLN